jgi:ataxia telangiectasia mutated family protein
MELSQSSKPNSRDKKKPRYESPLAALSSLITSENSFTLPRVARLQLLLFYLEKHYVTLDPRNLHIMVSDLIGVASAGNIELQPWALLCLTALASRYEVSVHGKEQRPDWEGAWRLALHLSTTTQSYRAACHLGYVLMSTNAIGLSELQLLKDVETFIRDLNVRGPSFPNETACRFLSQCLYVASRDVRLFRSHLGEKVLWWLSDRWKPTMGSKIGGSKTYAGTHFIADDILQLLAEISAMGLRPKVYSPQFDFEGFLPGVTVQRAKQKVILDYMLHVDLPAFRTTHHGHGELSPSAAGHRGVDGVEQHNRHQTTAEALRKLVETELEVFQSTEIPKELSSHQLQQALNLSVVAILFEALLLHNNLHSHASLRAAACTLISRLLPNLFVPQWSMTEQLLSVEALLPLVTDKPPEDRMKWQAILSPTERTGIRYEILRRSIGNSAERCEATKTLLSHLWQIPEASLLRNLKLVSNLVFDRCPSASVTTFHRFVESSLISRRENLFQP